jgi:hypothetical protein
MFAFNFLIATHYQWQKKKRQFYTRITYCELEIVGP